MLTGYRIGIRSLPASEPLMADLQALQQCFQAFANHQYTAAAQQAMGLIATQGSPELLQVLLLSLQRSGQTALFEQLGPRVLAAVAHPWYRLLFQVTLGQADPNAVVAQASGDEQLCSAHYAGSARLAKGQTAAAIAAFTRRGGVTADPIEKQFARAELAHLAVAHRVPLPRHRVRRRAPPSDEESRRRSRG
jgi:hypothetical protein